MSQNDTHLTPARAALAAFKSVRQLAIASRRHRSNVYRWLEQGLIPPKVQAILLAAAKERGLNLTAEDLISGRPVESKAS